MSANADNQSAANLLQQMAALAKGEELEVTGKVAEGGMGVIYTAHDLTLDRTTALKIMHDEFNQDNERILQFIEEAQITGQLEHPNIVPVHSLGVDVEGRPYFTMKFVEGDALSDILEAIRGGNEQLGEYYNQFQLLTIFRKVCDASAYAHFHNIVHRDIKPENIMIGSFGEVHLMDWGIAKFLGSREHTSSKERTLDAIRTGITQTLDGTIKGSPTYMSPEQARGETDQFDARSDVFLLGATLYHMLTLHHPYTADSVEEVVGKAETCDFIEPQQLNPEIPTELQNIILKAMSLNKEDRYQNVEEMGTDLDKFMAGNTISEKRKFKAGEIIINHGDQGQEAFVIIDGEVEVFKKIEGRKSVFTRLHVGDVFGEMALITDHSRSASVQAITDTVCLIITRKVMTEQLRKIPPWLDKTVTALTNRLRQSDTFVHPLLIADCTFEVINQVRLLMYCGGTVNQNGFIQLPIQELTYEVANNLKIPLSKVRPAIASLIENGFMQVTDTLCLEARNWHLFCDFVDFSKNAPRLCVTSTQTITDVQVQRTYTDGVSLVHRQLRLQPHDNVPPFGKLTPVRDEKNKEQALKLRRSFPKLLEQVQKYTRQAEHTQSNFQSGRSLGSFHPSIAPRVNPPITPEDAPVSSEDQ